jgi:hypothetical protein
VRSSSTGTIPVTLDELRGYLAGRGMTNWYLSARLEGGEALPRNGTGKVRKVLLRSWLNGEASLTEQEQPISRGRRAALQSVSGSVWRILSTNASEPHPVLSQPLRCADCLYPGGVILRFPSGGAAIRR